MNSNVFVIPPCMFPLVDDLTLVHGNDEEDIKIGMKEFQDFII